MTREVPIEFQRKLDDFNASIGGPSRVEVCWNPRTSRWEVWAVPVSDSAHPKARNDRTKELLRRFPDGSGREGVLLFVWCRRDSSGKDVGYVDLDDRIFTTLRWLDTFNNRREFERIMYSDEAKEAAWKEGLREIVASAVEYWKNIDNPTVSLDPSIRAPADWRTAKAWWR